MKITIIPVSLGFVKSFLVKGDKTIIVDAGIKGSSRRILRAMQANGIAPGDVSLILVTHGHGDHTGGMKELTEETSAPVAVHASEAVYLESGQSAPVVLHSWIMKLLSVFFRGQKIDAVKPDILIDGRLDLQGFGVDGFVLPTPGHTGGSVSLIIAGGDAITGDMVAGAAKPALPGVYSNLEALKTSVKSLHANAVTRVFTSHGGIHEIEEVIKLTL